MNALQTIEARARFGQRMGLDAIRGMLAKAGDFHKTLRVVHVAGTNGKGSVSAMVASALEACGHRVGLYTSPHLVTFHERIRIDGRDATDDELEGAVEALRPALDAFPEATYFEAATLLALRRFADARVDVAVLETGLGGRLDATNVFDKPLATVVTNVDLEHTDVLGADVESIAREKGGVVKPGVELVTGATGDALRVLRGLAFERGAPIRALGDDFVALPDEHVGEGQSLEVDGLRDWGTVHIPFEGAHQAENAAIALATLDAVDRAGLPVPVARAREGMMRARWPGRLQWVDGSPRVLLDGAHNPAGAAALGAYLDARKLRPVIVFGALADKDWQAMVNELAIHARDAVVTRPPSPRALDPMEAARAFSQAGVVGMVVEDPGHALQTAEGIAGPDGVVLVTGSLYLVGDILSRLPR